MIQDLPPIRIVGRSFAGPGGPDGPPVPLDGYPRLVYSARGGEIAVRLEDTGFTVDGLASDYRDLTTAGKCHAESVLLIALARRTTEPHVEEAIRYHRETTRGT